MGGITIRAIYVIETCQFVYSLLGQNKFKFAYKLSEGLNYVGSFNEFVLRIKTHKYTSCI